MRPARRPLSRQARLPSFLKTREGWADYLDLRRPAQPHLHQIEPTNHCGLRCVMCPRSKMVRPLGFIELDLYRQVLDEVATYDEPVRSKEIELFHFGESALHPRLDELVAHAASHRLRTLLSVKAPFLSPDLAERILAAGPDTLVVSLDGHDQATLRHVAGVELSWERTVARVEHAIEVHRRARSSTRLVLRLIRIHANAEQAEAFRHHWEQRGIEVDIRDFFPWGDAELRELGDYRRYPPGMPCPFPWQHLVVQWNGDVVPCCRDYDGALALGNVRESTLERIWNGPTCTDLREQHRSGDYSGNPVCAECMALYATEAEE